MPHKSPEARKIYQRAYREVNKERLKEKRCLYNLTKPEAQREANRKHYASNCERLKACRRAYREENVDACRASDKKYQAKRDKREYNSQRRGYYAANKDRILKQRSRRRRIDLNYKISISLRVRLCMAVRNGQKAGSAVRDLGCSVQELRVYIETRFQSGMTWKNWSRKGWHLDHVKPLSTFDLTDRGQFLEACHYTNLQPLWARENLRKGAKCG